MPYVSSSPVDESNIEIVSVTYTDYLTVDLTSDDATKTLTGNAIDDSYKVTLEGSNLRFTHSISDDMFAAYTITVRITNDDGIEKTWTIVQYPSIYITGKKAEGSLFVAGRTCTSGEYSSVTFSGFSLGSVQNPSTVNGEGTNNNYNNYTIYVSAFKEGDDYAIGDPRMLTSDDLSISDYLPDYYPTRSTGSEKIIAPAFKIASSRGKTTAISQDNAKRRCASYQEDGYPAGRWRIPTEAEIQFVVNLSADGKIPTLFDGNYWCATTNKYYSSDDKGVSTGTNSRAVRCVYDIWYWGTDQVDINKFTWNKDIVSN